MSDRGLGLRVFIKDIVFFNCILLYCIGIGVIIDGLIDRLLFI